MNSVIDAFGPGDWFYESGVWMFVPTNASAQDMWAASQTLDNLANAEYETEPRPARAGRPPAD